MINLDYIINSELIPSNMVGIALLCYLIGEAIKLTPIDNKFIPIVCGFSGAVLSVFLHNVLLDASLTTIFDAIGTGILAGLTAVGANQIYKQLKTQKQNGD